MTIVDGDLVISEPVSEFTGGPGGGNDEVDPDGHLPALFGTTGIGPRNGARRRPILVARQTKKFKVEPLPLHPGAEPLGHQGLDGLIGLFVFVWLRLTEDRFIGGTNGHGDVQPAVGQQSVVINGVLVPLAGRGGHAIQDGQRGTIQFVSGRGTVSIAKLTDGFHGLVPILPVDAVHGQLESQIDERLLHLGHGTSTAVMIRRKPGRPTVQDPFQRAVSGKAGIAQHRRGGLGLAGIGFIPGNSTHDRPPAGRLAALLDRMG